MQIVSMLCTEGITDALKVSTKLWLPEASNMGAPTLKTKINKKRGNEDPTHPTVQNPASGGTV
jgi:hypothetical protein